MYCVLHCTDLSVLWDCSCVSRSFTWIRDTQMTRLLIRSLSFESRVQIGRVSLCLEPFKHGSLLLLQRMKRSWPPLRSSSVHYMRPLRQCSPLELSRLLPYVMCHQLVAFSHHKFATSPVQKRLALIRIFSFLSVPIAVIVVSTGFLRTIIHFMLKVCICHRRGSFGLIIVVKNDLISECTALATGRGHVAIWGVWSSSPGDNLSPGEAARCVSF